MWSMHANTFCTSPCAYIIIIALLAQHKESEQGVVSGLAHADGQQKTQRHKTTLPPSHIFIRETRLFVSSRCCWTRILRGVNIVIRYSFKHSILYSVCPHHCRTNCVRIVCLCVCVVTVEHDGFYMCMKTYFTRGLLYYLDTGGLRLWGCAPRLAGIYRCEY